MDWPTYVRRTVGKGERQLDIAKRTGVDQTTISRWLSGGSRSLTPATVAKFARGYDRPVVDAFVHAGLITEEDAQLRTRSLAAFTLSELLAEAAKRTATEADAS